VVVVMEDTVLVDVLRADNARLRRALAFYADAGVYKPHPHGPAFDRRDLSFCAKAALAEQEPR
jgi:hypothetical protein